MLLNAKLWPDLLYEQCVFPLMWVCSSVYASFDRGLERLYSNLYTCVHTSCHRCFMSLLKQTRHSAQRFWCEKRRDLVCGCGPQLQQPFCELPASEVFTQRPCVPLYEQGARSMWFGLDFLKCFSITAVQESQTHSDFRFLCPIDRIYLLLVFVTSPTAKGIDV